MLGKVIRLLRALLLPANTHRIPGERWINIGLRASHLVGVTGSGAGFLFAVGSQEWMPFWHLTVISGVAMTGLYIASTPGWLLQLKGLLIVAKVAALLVGSAFPVWRAEIFIGIIVVSALIAHAPARVRGWTWRAGA